MTRNDGSSSFRQKIFMTKTKIHTKHELINNKNYIYYYDIHI